MNGWLESWTGLLLDDPWWLAAALVVPIALLVALRRGAAALPFAPAALFDREPLPRSWRSRLAFAPRGLQALGLVLMAVALARPVERVELPRESSGIDVFLCVDVSSSMAATDLDPQSTRLEVAKAAAARFVTARETDRIGLIRFARYPDLVCPPTLDHDALLRFLAGVEMVAAESEEDRTGIGTALARAAAALRSSDAPSRIVILLTDGEENVATAEAPDEIGPPAAARICEELGIRVYTIAVGIGKRGPDGTFVPLDVEPVRQVAEVTGGRFFAARDAGALLEVYEAIDALERAPFREPRYLREDRFLPFLIAALVALLVGRGLSATGLEVRP